MRQILPVSLSPRCSSGDVNGERAAGPGRPPDEDLPYWTTIVVDLLDTDIVVDLAQEKRDRRPGRHLLPRSVVSSREG
jgi:hypothetical protein